MARTSRQDLDRKPGRGSDGSSKPGSRPKPPRAAPRGTGGRGAEAPAREPRPEGEPTRGKPPVSRRPVQRRARRGRPAFRPAPEPQVEPSAEGIRLQKVIAAAGVASRRRSEELITAGRVWVDGRVVTELGTRVDPKRARIEVDGVRVHVHPDHEYYVLNKPLDVITTASDPHGRRTVVQMVRSKRRLFPVGRLDADTTGVLLMTDDGELAHRLAHPRFQIPRVYIAEVRGAVPDEACRRLERGIRLDDGPARAVRAQVRDRGRRSSQIEITMSEGRKREVRRMLEAVGFPVESLARISFGPVKISGLRVGETRRLDAGEVGELHRLVGL